MISLINIVEDIKNDFTKKEYMGINALARTFVLKGNNKIGVSIIRCDESCELKLMIPQETSTESLNMLPKWKGMETKVTISGNEEEKYLVFRQLDGYDQAIFLSLMQNIIEEICNVDFFECVFAVKNVLKKWSMFFKFESDYVLSTNAQQGLYGELFVLEKIIQQRGVSALNGWTGYNSETHDFYYGDDAIEVKSSSSKGPEKFKVNNEYQLDDAGVGGKLYLLYLNMKKSEVDGERLPDIVERIMENFNHEQKALFKEKLFKVGYIYMMPDLYKHHFRVRDESCYDVKEGFPRITPSNLSRGLGSVEYVVSLDACSSFLMETESFYEGVNSK